MPLLELIFVSAIPALGLLVVWLLMDRWGRKHDPMGGRPGRIWKPDDTWRRLGRK